LRFIDLLLDVFQGDVRVARDRLPRILRKQGYENRKTQQDGKLEEHLTAIAEKDPPAAGEEGRELGEESGSADLRLLRGSRRLPEGNGIRLLPLSGKLQAAP